jgi:RNA polymerase sigma-70 factor (ECF subfamily)
VQRREHAANKGEILLMPLAEQGLSLSEPDDLAGDSELVSLARAGNSRAFEMLYTRYCEQIKLYLARMVGNDAIGHELAQEAFLRAWQALPGLQNNERFVGWLYRIATNIARDHQRHAGLIRWLPWELQPLRGSQVEISSAGMEEHVEENELLRMALAQVPFKYRACLILYIVEELPQAQIAERLGIKASYVSNYVGRGLAELRRLYVRLASERKS